MKTQHNEITQLNTSIVSLLYGAVTYILKQ